MDDIYYVYGHYTKDTNQLFYIGLGKDRRCNAKSARSDAWKEFVTIHGFTVKILFTATDRDAVIAREEELLRECANLKINLVNRSLGNGTKGINPTEHSSFKGFVEAIHVGTEERLVLCGNSGLLSKGFNPSKVSACTLGKRQSHKGHTFKRLPLSYVPLGDEVIYDYF